jgi:hypothetical protein
VIFVNTYYWVRTWNGSMWATLYMGWDSNAAHAAATPYIARQAWVIVNTITDEAGAQWRPYDVWSQPPPPEVAGGSPICNPAANPPPPKDARIRTSVTPAMQRACKARADDLAVPIGSELRTTIDGARVVLWVSCHGYTQVGDQRIPGAFHGCSVYDDLSPASAPAPAVGETTDWGAVAVTAGAIGTVVAGFWLMLRAAGRK